MELCTLTLLLTHLRNVSLRLHMGHGAIHVPAGCGKSEMRSHPGDWDSSATPVFETSGTMNPNVAGEAERYVV